MGDAHKLLASSPKGICNQTIIVRLFFVPLFKQLGQALPQMSLEYQRTHSKARWSVETVGDMQCFAHITCCMVANQQVSLDCYLLPVR